MGEDEDREEGQDYAYRSFQQFRQDSRDRCVKQVLTYWVNKVSGGTEFWG